MSCASRRDKTAAPAAMQAGGNGGGGDFTCRVFMESRTAAQGGEQQHLRPCRRHGEEGLAQGVFMEGSTAAWE
eukprot:29259-Chlamydomonas_euryale.AAC.1